MNAGKIGVDGTVSVDFSHASEYVIVIGKNMETTAQTQAAGNQNPVSGMVANNGTEQVVSPKTGETMPLVPVAAMAAVVLMLLGYVGRYKKEQILK